MAMDIYNAYSEVPVEAQKKITGGRLNGMTDINPMWRIKSLTEAFGMAGVGWYTTVDSVDYTPGANDEVSCQVKISLFVKVGEEWSKPIVGVGGSMYVTAEKSGLRTSDEAYKMAYTDALSVACKALGFGANVYWEAGRTKYSIPHDAPDKPYCSDCGKEIRGVTTKDKTLSPAEVADSTKKMYGRTLCTACAKAERERRAK